MQNKTAVVKSASGSSTLTGAPVGATQYEMHNGDAHYAVGVNENGDLYAERFSYPGWANAGTTVTIHIGRKRAIVTRIWSAGFNDRSWIENQKYISVSHASVFMGKFHEIVNEKDDVEREELILQLARDIIMITGE